MDPECRALVERLNGNGVETIGSCCGHAERPFFISFKVQDLPALHRLLYRLEDVPYFREAWKVEAHMSAASLWFSLTGPVAADGDRLARELAP